MSTTYTGDPTNNPASITIPSDGDGPIQAADVNTAFEALADQIAFMDARFGWALRSFTTASGGASQNTTSTTDVDVTGATTGAIAALAGDKFKIHVHCDEAQVTNGEVGQLRIVSAGVPLASFLVYGAASALHGTADFAVYYTVPSSGNYTFKVTMFTAFGGTITLSSNAIITAELWRPV